MKTALKHCFGLWLAATAALHAQVPAPAPGPGQVPPTTAPGAPAAQPPPAETPRTNIAPVFGTNSSFFQRNTNFGRPRTDIAPATNTAVRPFGPGAGQPTAVVPGAGQTRPGGANVPGAAVPGQPNIPNIPGLQAPPVTPSVTATSANYSATNIVARGSTNEIPTRMLNFQEADLTQIFELYAIMTRRTLIKSPQVPANVKITIRNETPLTIEEGIDALNTILGLNGISMVMQGEKFIKAVPQATVGPEAINFTTNAYTELRDSKAPLAHIVTLKNLAPEEATSLLQPFANLPNSIVALKGSPVLILRDYSENVKRMIEVLEKVDIYVPPEIETVVIPIKYALAGEIASVLSGLGAASGGSFGTAAGGGGFGGGGFGGGGLGGFGGGLGGGLGGINRYGGGYGGGYGGSQYGGGYNRYGGGYNRYSGGVGTYGTGVTTPTTTTTPGGGSFAGASRTGFGSRLNQAVNRAVGAAGGGGQPDEFVLINNAKIIPDERSNALLVFADKRDLVQISNIISKLDVVLPQVLIEALIMEVNIGDGHSVGVSVRQNNQKLGDLDVAGGSINGPGFLNPRNITSIAEGSNGLPSGFSYFGKLNESFDFAVTAAANDSRINVLSRPRVVTSTAKPASIFVGETRPYITGSYFSDFTGAGSRSQYAQTQIGISLNVLPIVNQEGLVVMDIQQQISQVGATVKIDNNDVPTTIDRNANAYVAVHDRDTILLGGFISTTKNKSKSGVPYLKDIPGLGVLFRSSSENVSRVELMVLIRPTVLPTPEAAAVHTAMERDRHTNIKAAEREVEEFQQKQIERERKEEERLERRRR